MLANVIPGKTFCEVAVPGEPRAHTPAPKLNNSGFVQQRCLVALLHVTVIVGGP